MKKERATFLLTKAEKSLLREIVVYEPFLQENLGRIKREGTKDRISFDADDLFDAISALKYYQYDCGAADRREERMTLIEKLDGYLKLIVKPGQKLGV